MSDGRPALLDVNVLLALVVDQHVHHRAAHRRFATVRDSWATCSTTENGLLRLLLTPQVLGRPITAGEALGVLAAIRELPGWSWVDDDASLADARRSVDVRVLASRSHVTDLHLLELAIRHGMALHTFDAALARIVAPADRPSLVIWTD